MKRILLALVLLAGCATGPAPIDDARKRFDEGRSDEALALLQKSLRDKGGKAAKKPAARAPAKKAAKKSRARARKSA